MISRVAGIPCRIRVDYFMHQPALGPGCDSDWDAKGYTDIDFTVLDRSGRDAPWLERKLTDDDRNRINQEIEDFRNEQIHCH